MDRHHDNRTVDGRAVQGSLKGDRHAGGVDRSVRSVAAGQVPDGTHDVALLRIEHGLHAQALQDGASCRRRVAHDHANPAAPEREENADADRTAPVDDRRLAGLDIGALGRAPGNGHRLNEGPLFGGEAAGQLVRHRPAHHRVLREPAAAAVVPMEGQKAAMIVSAGRALQAHAAGLDRLDGDAVAQFQVFDARAEGGDLTAELMPEDHGILHACQRMWREAGGNRAVVVLVQIASANAVEQHSQLDLTGAG